MGSGFTCRFCLMHYNNYFRWMHCTVSQSLLKVLENQNTKSKLQKYSFHNCPLSLLLMYLYLNLQTKFCIVLIDIITGTNKCEFVINYNHSTLNETQVY